MLSTAAGRAKLVNLYGSHREPASDAADAAGGDQVTPAPDAADVRCDDQITPTHNVTLANLTHPDSIHLN
eukprot:3647478-Prymnesium_polylepis.1